MPSGEVKTVTSIQMPMMIRATIAMTLMIANQNSISPNSLTVSRLRNSRNPSMTTARTSERGFISVGWSGLTQKFQ